MPNDEGFVGRSIAFTWDSKNISGVREKGVKLDGTPVDVSSGEDGGWALLLDEPGENKIEVSLSGVTKSDVLKIDWFAGTRVRAVSLTYPNGSVIAGNFFLASYSEKGPYKDATTFEATLQSTGVVQYTPYS